MKAAGLKELLSKYRFAVICGTGSLLLAAFAGFRYLSISDQTEVLAERSDNGRRMQANIANSASLKEQVDALVAVNERILSRTVKPDNLGENLQYFYKIEAATDAKTNEVKQTYSPPISKGPKPVYIQVPYNISLLADYGTALNFLRKVEKGPRVARITSVVFTNSAEATSANMVNVSATIELLGTP